ncbi:MAG TPA: xanthine dehydrogenase family protein subunit M [Caldimonas sp.]|nr:xanthine dehydrogenase family protein subunit M [Caldimonas sp.]
MKPPAFDYVRAHDVAHAVSLLAAHGADATPLAGGQSLMPALNFRLASPALLVDLNAIGELSACAVDDDGSLLIGATARHRHVETSSTVARGWPLLAHAMGSVAHVAIRNRGTIGGSLCHADPSAEWPALCIACEAHIELRSARGTRDVAAADFMSGLFTTVRASDELLVRVRFPRWPATRRWGFREVARRRGDFAIAGTACTVDVDAAGACTDARVVVFGVADGPVRASASEAALRGRRPDAAAIRAAAVAALTGLEPRSDAHASSAYRLELVRTLTARALGDALGVPA